ncbi:MAG: hypothetical protein LC750_18515 [Actinobacteria bacterium]|nr:hypothetical protein [Actinomycetota bacterium]
MSGRVGNTAVVAGRDANTPAIAGQDPHAVVVGKPRSLAVCERFGVGATHPASHADGKREPLGKRDTGYFPGIVGVAGRNLGHSRRRSPLVPERGSEARKIDRHRVHQDPNE